MSKLWEMEDYLQDNHCFTNGISGSDSHMNSYMSCLEYKQIDKCLDSGTYTKEDWLNMANEYSMSDQIMEKLLRLTILRKFNK